MQCAANARTAVELAQARLAGISLASSEESEERKRASVLHELSGVDLSVSFADVELLMSRRLNEARALAMESVVAWEIEEELSAVQKTSVDAVSQLERRLDEVESWLSGHSRELCELKAGMDALLRENKAVEMQRVNIGKLDVALNETIGALSLPAGTEEALLNPRKLLEKGESLGPTVDAYQAAIRRAAELKKTNCASAAVDERQDELRALGDALCSETEKHVRGQIERAARKFSQQHNSRQQLESMSAGALRSKLRRRQREFHAGLKSEAGEAVATLKRMTPKSRDGSLRRLRIATACTVRDLVYGPLLRAYVHALVAEDNKSASSTLARALEELRPLVVDERRAFREFYGGDEAKTQFGELRELLTNMVEVGGGRSVEAAAILGVAEDAGAEDAWWRETQAALKKAATGKWRGFVEDLCQWIRSAEVSKKREHGSGPSRAATEIVSFSQKLERILAEVPRKQETRQRLKAEVARPAFVMVARAFDDWLSKAVAADSKYGVLVELENADFVASRSPGLARINRGKANDAVRRYSDWMWSYEFAKVDAFFSKVERKEKTSSSSLPSSAAIDDNLNKIFKRLEKHFPDGSRADPEIRPKLKNVFVDHFKAKWANYASLYLAHFHKSLVPTLQQFENLLAKNE